MIARTDLNTLPVDKGWAWAIAAAGFLSTAVVTAGLQIRALLFLETLQVFDASLTTGSLVFMFSPLAASVTSVIVTNYVMPKLTERGCLLVGGITSFVLALGLAFSPNIGVFIAILTVKGIVTGLVYVPGMALIPPYFKRYRSRAAMVPFCGGSAANIITPFLVRAATDEYGVMGVYFLFSAIELHYCVAGLLLRPVMAYRRDQTMKDDTGTVIEHKKDDTIDTPANMSLTRWQTFYQGSALGTCGFRGFLLSAVPGSAVRYMTNYIPTICKYQGVSFDQAAFLTTIMGAVELISRIATGFIADTKVLLPSQLAAITLVCLGIGCHFLRFATTFETLIPVIIAIGIFLATRAPVQTLVCVEVVGPKKYPQAFSVYILVLTFCSSLFNPALGALVEATGSFVHVLHILGSCFFLCAGLLACLPLFVRLDVQRGRKK